MNGGGDPREHWTISVDRLKAEFMRQCHMAKIDYYVALRYWEEYYIESTDMERIIAASIVVDLQVVQIERNVNHG